jgi:hypothetical protein
MPYVVAMRSVHTAALLRLWGILDEGLSGEC